MDSKIALIIQITGVVLITILTIFLRRSLNVLALKYWTYAWLCLSFALISLRLAFSSEQHSDSLNSLYFFGEYLFGFLPRLKNLAALRKIEIMEIRRLYFGSLYHEGYSYVAWRPL